MPMICPCCLQAMPVERAPIDVLELAPLTPMERKIVKALADSYPRRVTMRQLVDACYWDDPEGGPDNPNGTIYVTVSHLRRKLRAYGWTIPKIKCGPVTGYNAYCLAPVESP